MVQQVHEIYFGFQVHGIVHDTIDFVRGLITTEMNSATDNPIVLVSLTRALLVTLSFKPLSNLNYPHSNAYNHHRPTEERQFQPETSTENILQRLLTTLLLVLILQCIGL